MYFPLMMQILGQSLVTLVQISTLYRPALMFGLYLRPSAILVRGMLRTRVRKLDRTAPQTVGFPGRSNYHPLHQMPTGIVLSILRPA